MAAFLVALSLLAAPTTPAQTEGANQQEVPAGLFSEVVEVGSVLIPVVVRSNDGAYLSNLKRKDFRLFVDDRPVPIESFERRAEAPISVVFLQDLSGSMATANRLEASRRAIEQLLSQARWNDEFAVATFAGGALSVEVPFTSSLPAVRESVSLWEAYGTTALHDAVAWLPEIGGEGRHPKRAAILLTDGADNASRISPHEARNIVRRAQLPVYILGLDAGDPNQPSPRGSRVHKYADVLNLLGHYTGGRYIEVAPDTDIKTVIGEIAADLRNQYVLSFRMERTGDRADHQLRVEVPGHKVRVATRQGYRGTPPAAWKLP